MSALKSNNSGSMKRKSMLNTTVDTEIFEKFKDACKQSGIKMNTLIEVFMEQYVAGEFVLRFGRNKRTIDFLEDDN